MSTALAEDRSCLRIGMPAPRVAPEPVSDFGRWIAGTRVVDGAGRPLVVFHGTNQDFSAFSDQRLGAVTGNISAREGFFFTDSPEVASDYAAYAGRQVVANVAAHEAKTRDLSAAMTRAERRGDWDEYERLTEQLEAHEIGAMRAGEQGSVVIPVYLAMKRPLEIDMKGRSPASDEVLGVLQRARGAGCDGVILRQINDSPSNVGLSTQYVVFRPDQVRFALGLQPGKRPGLASPAKDLD